MAEPGPVCGVGECLEEASDRALRRLVKQIERHGSQLTEAGRQQREKVLAVLAARESVGVCISTDRDTPSHFPC